MYVTVQKGDRLPTVALAQARLVERGASQLVVDGIFGPNTRAAVDRFQTTAKLPVTGAVDQASWRALALGAPLSVVDVIDASDITVLQEDGPFLNDGQSHVQVNYGMSRGALVLIDRLVATNPPRSVCLLRLHGHGGPGEMRVAGGGRGVFASSSFAAGHFAIGDAVTQYRRLGSIMKRYGSIEMHGCRVAVGLRGRKLLSGLADTCKVPVSAALGYQTGAETANRFEGQTVTSFPFGLTLSSWAARVFSQCQW